MDVHCAVGLDSGQDNDEGGLDYTFYVLHFDNFCVYRGQTQLVSQATEEGERGDGQQPRRWRSQRKRFLPHPFLRAQQAER